MPRLTDAQYTEAIRLISKSGITSTQCPTCGSKQIDVDADHWGRENGTYRYRDEDHECDCDLQIQLHRHYTLANIPDQFQRLDWADLRNQDDVKEWVNKYLDLWPSMKVNGMGIEFSSYQQGVGKTFSATYVAKELVKKGETVYFSPFRSVISAFADGRGKELQARMRDTTVLVLDEVIPAISDAQHNLFADLFEEIIRTRTDFNRVTIMTTNLQPDELRAEYPRVYSLLEAKQMRLEMNGEDARQTFIDRENLDLAFNGEVRPIT